MKLEERILCDLISIDSQTSKSNSEIISYIEGHYKGFDVKKHGYEKGENLVVRILGRSRGNPILIAGHTDTVDMNGTWRTNPFSPQRIRGEIVGLGACDMKGSLAGIITATKLLRSERDIYLVFDGSEEDNSQGARAAVGILPNIQNAIILIPEPTNKVVYLSQNGYFNFYVDGEYTERKLKPTDDAEKEKAKLLKTFRGTIQEGFWNPPYSCRNKRTLIRRIRKINPTMRFSENPFAGWTEAAIFSRYGQVFIFGAGDYTKSHKPNESIKVRDIEYFSTFLKRMLTYK